MKNPEPLYYAIDLCVFKRSVKTQKDHGASSFALGFRVCDVSEDLLGGAEIVAKMMNAGSKALGEEGNEDD